jgi:DNA-binding XRE family transcriptional regulator
MAKMRRVYDKPTPERRAKLKELRDLIETEKPEIVEKARKVRKNLDRREAELKAIFNTLREERKSQGLSLADVKERTGMSREFISQLENGIKANPTITTIERYAAALGQKVVLRLERAGS